MKTKLATFDTPVTSHKNFVLMWETNPITGTHHRSPYVPCQSDYS